MVSQPRKMEKNLPTRCERYKVIQQIRGKIISFSATVFNIFFITAANRGFDRTI
jgi:hypothetical protein